VVAQAGRGADKGAGGGRTASARSRGCLAAWASVDVGDGGTEPAVFPVRGDDGAVGDDN